MQGYATASGAAPRIGEWLSEAFSLFQRQWQAWVGQGLIFFTLCVLPLVLAWLGGYFGMFLAAFSASTAGSYYSSPAGSYSSSPAGGAPPPELLAGMFLWIALVVVLALVSTLLQVYLMCGMTHTAAKQLRGEPIAARDIFGAGYAFWPALGASILAGLASCLAAILCIVPGYLVAGMLIYAIPLVVHQRLGATEALSRSWEVTRPHVWMYLLWLFVISIIAGLGGYACAIGAAVTIPIYVLAIMVGYRDSFGLPGAMSPVTAGRVSPAVATPLAPVGNRCPSCGAPVTFGAVACPACGQAFVPPSGPTQPYV